MLVGVLISIMISIVVGVSLIPTIVDSINTANIWSVRRTCVCLCCRKRKNCGFEE